ncbi:MAG TPA: ABC transporter permease [Caldilineaceae bacterium]|nr:ABC transporter permease [Caldilineaceae bacterium]
MISYLLRRLGISIILLIGISIVSFIIIQLPPGDFASTYKTFLISNAGMTEDKAEEATQMIRARYGLDKPMHIQYINWVKGIVTRGEFGFSFAYRRDVGQLIWERLPKTLMLALAAHLISTVIGIALGIYTATRQYGWADNLSAIFAFVLSSLPRFFIALVIMYMLVFTFRQTHITSFFSPQYVVAPWSWAKFVDLIQHVWPVILIAGLGGIARNMRTMRGNLLDVLNAQYVTTARAKGLRERAVINRHAVPNALHPVIAYQGTVLPYMIQGELEAAIILNIPSAGPMFYDSLVTQDIYLSAGFLLMISTLIVIGNLIADLSMAVLDPRIRYS